MSILQRCRQLLVKAPPSLALLGTHSHNTATSKVSRALTRHNSTFTGSSESFTQGSRRAQLVGALFALGPVCAILGYSNSQCEASGRDNQSAREDAETLLERYFTRSAGIGNVVDETNAERTGEMAEEKKGQKKGDKKEEQQEKKKEEKKEEQKEEKKDDPKKAAAKPAAKTQTVPRSQPELYFSSLVHQRVIFLHGRVSEHMADSVVQQLVYLNNSSATEPIHMYIQTGGGSVYAGLAIYDMMQQIEAPVHTTCLGFAMSMGAIILAGGEPGHRRALPNARMMVHQPHHLFHGKTSDVVNHSFLAQDIKLQLARLLAEDCGRDVDAIMAIFDKPDHYLTPEQAVDFGLIDAVTESKKKRRGDGKPNERSSEVPKSSKKVSQQS